MFLRRLKSPIYLDGRLTFDVPIIEIRADDFAIVIEGEIEASFGQKLHVSVRDCSYEDGSGPAPLSVSGHHDLSGEDIALDTAILCLSKSSSGSGDDPIRVNFHGLLCRSVTPETTNSNRVYTRAGICSGWIDEFWLLSSRQIVTLV